MSEGSSPLKGAKLAQVAIAVQDIDAARKRWAAVLGVDPPNIIETAPGEEVRMRFRGRSSNSRAKLAFFDLGGVQLELIEPIGGDSTWNEGLEQNGEAVHHIAFWTDDMAQTAEALKGHGVSLVQRGDMGEGQYAYFDASPLGCVIELLEHKRSGEIG